MESQNYLIKLTAKLVLATLIVFILVIGKSFLVPLAWSLLIALSSLKIIEWFEHKTKVPKGLTILLFLIIIIAIISSIGYFFYIELDRIFADMPAITSKIAERLQNLSLHLADKGIAMPDHLDKTYISDWVNKHNDIFLGFLSSFGLNLWNVILIFFYMFFLLYYKDLIPAFLNSHVQEKRRLVIVRDRVEKSLTLVRSYLYGLLILTLILAVLNYLIFIIFGIKFALFFAVFLAVLNLIPFIGNLVGLVVILFFTFITKDNAIIPVLILISLTIVNFLQDNIFRPWIIGDKLKINAFTVFLAIILGGIIWGISGMILFIPLVGIIKIIIENDEKHSSYAIFFSDINKATGPQKAEISPENTDS